MMEKPKVLQSTGVEIIARQPPGPPEFEITERYPPEENKGLLQKIRLMLPF